MKMLKQEVKTLYDVYFNLFDQQDKEILVIIETETIEAKIFGTLQKIEGWRNEDLNMYKIELTVNDQIIKLQNPSQISTQETKNNTIQYFIDNVMIEHEL
jgi:hypothetical protein